MIRKEELKELVKQMEYAFAEVLDKMYDNFPDEECNEEYYREVSDSVNGAQKQFYNNCNKVYDLLEK